MAVHISAMSGALQEGDTIAIRGAESLTEGAEVNVILSSSASVKGDIDEG